MSGSMGTLWRRVIAVFLCAGSVGASFLIGNFATAIGAQWPVAVANNQVGVFLVNGALLLGFVALIVASFLGGVLLWRNHRLGRIFATSVLGAQLIFLAMPHFQYKVALLGFIGFGLAGSRIGFFFDTYAQFFVEFDPDNLRAFVVNIPALVMFVSLIKKT